MTEAVMADCIGRAARQGLRIAVAESLTGGLLADAFVSVAGASAVFSGGVVAYDTVLKHTLLAVNRELLCTHGPVHELVAQQLAHGVRETCAVQRDDQSALRAADIGLATTGIAGPDSDQRYRVPVGTVWIGVSSRLGDRASRLCVRGDRGQVRAAAVRAAVAQLAIELGRIAAV